jgi:hypothetical protein
MPCPSIERLYFTADENLRWRERISKKRLPRSSNCLWANIVNIRVWTMPRTTKKERYDPARVTSASTDRALHDYCKTQKHRSMARAARPVCAGGILSLIEFFYEAALFDLAQQALIDKRLRIGGLGLGIILFDETEHSFNAAQRRIRDRLVVFVD